MTEAEFFSEMHLNDGASDADIGKAEAELGMALPFSYTTFLRRHNGGEGFIGENYLVLWKADELVPFNADYQVGEYAPGFFFFASNGGGEGFAFDVSIEQFPVYIIPFIGMSRQDAIFVANGFSDFFAAIRKDEFWPT